MDNTKNMIFRASLWAIGGVIVLKVFDYIRGENSPFLWYILNSVIFFVIVIVREYFVNGFLFSLSEPEKQLTKEENLRKIYSKKSDSELEMLVSSETIEEEAKIIAGAILNSRKGKNEA
ncbi:hypothetical protein K6119_10700 [Paracrocinitomix mangrovi]|uniref:hypothetical protein n=1 Tax=Paracrocinitomix mangrovi TaxID=2862509 RepID=UPI001C8E3493|nr:hypothetical protein [Paracrocinitomix mangrovi]UKN00201.1 hypothetical protein K6119_10700 [Paracrocinitomix mangrovi]